MIIMSTFESVWTRFKKPRDHRVSPRTDTVVNPGYGMHGVHSVLSVTPCQSRQNALHHCDVMNQSNL